VEAEEVLPLVHHLEALRPAAEELQEAVQVPEAQASWEEAAQGFPTL
jgi:hypothetical protein